MNFNNYFQFSRPLTNKKNISVSVIKQLNTQLNLKCRKMDMTVVATKTNCPMTILFALRHSLVFKFFSNNFG